MKKMLVATDTKFELVQKYKDFLAPIIATTPCLPFELHFADLDKLVESSDIKLVLEVIAILETSAASGPLVQFELDLAAKFIKNSMLTAFPDTR